jgi:hypothetical protein
MRPSSLIPLLLLAAGPAPAAAGASGAPGGEAPFVAEGEIVLRGSAAYDATRVRGPRVNMALTRDGRWGGNVLDADVILEVRPDRISGAGVNLVVTRDAGTLAVEGLVSGVRVRVKATRDELVARVGQRQIECVRSPAGTWVLRGGSQRVEAIRLKGSADRIPDVPLPQWILALIGAL